MRIVCPHCYRSATCLYRLEDGGYFSVFSYSVDDGHYHATDGTICPPDKPLYCDNASCHLPLPRGLVYVTGSVAASSEVLLMEAIL